MERHELCTSITSNFFLRFFFNKVAFNLPKLFLASITSVVFFWKARRQEQSERGEQDTREFFCVFSRHACAPRLLRACLHSPKKKNVKMQA